MADVSAANQRLSGLSASDDVREQHDRATGDLGNTSPLITYTDTLSVTKANHALKFGAEFRYAYSSGWSPAGASSLIPTVNGGASDVPVRGIDQVPNLLPPNITLAQNTLLFLT